MLPPRPRQRVEYHRPRRINAVSVTLMLIVGACAWVGFSFWPLIVLRSNVKNELAEAIPHLWRSNLRPDSQARAELTALRRQLVERLHQLGVKDSKLDLAIERNKKWVSMTAHYSATGSLRGWDKTFVFAFAPKVETDAARVDW
jgi:hypothetical protein